MPRTFWMNGQSTDNDLRQIISTWRIRAGLKKEHQLQLATLELNQKLARDNFDGARTQLEALAVENPENLVVFHALGGVLRHLGQVAGARSALERALMLVPPTSPQRAVVLHDLSYLALANPTASLLADADHWSDDAIKGDPDTLILQCIRGSVLIALDRFDEGRPFLEAVISKSADPHDQAIGRAYLARAAFFQGDHAKAIALFAEVSALKVKQELVTVVEKELRAAGLKIPALY
jgi:predicted Zn-dependent protease